MPATDALPERGRRRARLVPVLVALAATVLAAEGAVRAIEPALDAPRLYADDTTAVKVLQMERRGCADVVLAGNSMGRDAFDPGAFTAADPARRRAYNASLDAASPALLRRWLLEEVVPRLRPGLVVVTLASLDLNTNSAASRSALDTYERADMTASGPAAAAGRALIERSALVRHRRQLRDPLAVAAAAGNRRAGHVAPRLSADSLPGVIGPDGEGRSRRNLRYRHDATTRAFTRQQLLAGWELDAAQVEALGELLTGLRAAGAQAVVTLLPVTRDYVALHPGGDADTTRFRAAVQDRARSAGVPVVDLHDETPAGAAGDAAFADTHHLNAEGQRWFSATLPQRLGPSVTARSACAG